MLSSPFLTCDPRGAKSPRKCLICGGVYGIAIRLDYADGASALDVHHDRAGWKSLLEATTANHQATSALGHYKGRFQIHVPEVVSVCMDAPFHVGFDRIVTKCELFKSET